MGIYSFFASAVRRYVVSGRATLLQKALNFEAERETKYGKLTGQKHNIFIFSPPLSAANENRPVHSRSPMLRAIVVSTRTRKGRVVHMYVHVHEHTSGETSCVCWCHRAVCAGPIGGITQVQQLQKNQHGVRLSGDAKPTL